MVPRAEHGRVGGVFPSLHHVGAGSQTVGVEVPHAVVVALHAAADEGIDAALVEARDEVHAPVDVMARVVVDLSLGIADDGLRAPDVAVLSALAIAVDAGSIGLSDASYANGELGGSMSRSSTLSGVKITPLPAST